MSNGYVITLEHATDITDAEARRRLAAAYSIILAASRRALAEKAADGETLAGEPSAASDAREIVRAATGSIT